MARKSRVQEVVPTSGEAIFNALKDNPYVQRILADEDLRDQVRDVIENGRSAYTRASKAKKPGKALIKDQKLQKDLRNAFEGARTATTALRDAPGAASVGRKGGKGRLLFVALIGTGIALVASSGLRDKVLDLLFGPEETFDYVPTSNGNGTSAATPAAAPSAT